MKMLSPPCGHGANASMTRRQRIINRSKCISTGRRPDSPRYTSNDAQTPKWTRPITLPGADLLAAQDKRLAELGKAMHSAMLGAKP